MRDRHRLQNNIREHVGLQSPSNATALELTSMSRKSQLQLKKVLPRSWVAVKYEKQKTARQDSVKLKCGSSAVRLDLWKMAMLPNRQTASIWDRPKLQKISASTSHPNTAAVEVISMSH
jgi:hypothetical protein